MSSWGAILDVKSLREVDDVPSLPELIMSLPSTSLVSLSYTLKMPHQFATNTVSFVHFYPKTSEQIMLLMPVNVQCGYMLPISYYLANSNQSNAKEALVRFGVLGPAENNSWNINTACQGVTDVNVRITVFSITTILYRDTGYYPCTWCLCRS